MSINMKLACQFIGCTKRAIVVCSCDPKSVFCFPHNLSHPKSTGIHESVLLKDLLKKMNNLIHKSKQDIKLAEIRILSEGKQRIDFIIQQIRLSEKRLNEIAACNNLSNEIEIQSLVQFSFQEFKEIDQNIDFARQLELQKNNLNEKMNLISKEFKEEIFEEFKEKVNNMLNNNNVMKKFKNVYTDEEFSLQGHLSGITSVAISSDCKYIVSGSFDETIKVWNIQKRREEFSLQGHLG